MKNEDVFARKVFILFLSCQFLLWVLIPTLFIKVIPYDTAEAAAWGYEWQMGYFRHPPLVAWLANIAIMLEGYPGIGVYILAQLCVVITFIAVWKLTKSFFNSSVYALISVLSLSSIYYYSFPAMQFNNNIAGWPIWALLVLYTYKTAIKYSVKNWVIIGILAGLGILVKYEVVFLFVPALLFFLLNKNTRKQLWSKGFLAAVIVYFLIITPHLIWLFKNNFLPVLYYSSRTNLDGSTGYLWNHIHWPLDYLMNIFLPAIPTFILFFILSFRNKEKHLIERNLFNTYFIIFVALGAFVCTFFITLITGVHVMPYWTMTYYNFIGTALLYLLRPKINIKSKRLKTFIVLCFMAVAIPPLITAGLTKVMPPQIDGASTLIQYPGEQIAEYAEQSWRKYAKTDFKYIACVNYHLAAYVNCYAKQRPHTYNLAVKWQTPWATDEILQKYGALFLWEEDSANLGDKINKEFKGKIIFLPPKNIPWLKGSVLEQCKGHPLLTKHVLMLSKYFPFLKEKTEPILLKGAVLLPSGE